MRTHGPGAAPDDARPGWFGKLPGMGDFAHRRLPSWFRSAWDAWLQAGLQGLRERGDGWTEHYLSSPAWRFVLGEQVAGPRAWAGVLMPSVDSVGRYFPFTLVAPWPVGALEPWWTQAMEVALRGLDDDLDAAGFESLLRARSFTPDATGGAVPPPQPGHSLWLAGEGGARLCVAGLPTGRDFDALFGCGEGA